MTLHTLQMGVSVRRAILAHAMAETPNECCGFLVGREQTVLCSVAMENTDPGPRRYRIADEAHLELRRLLRRASPPLAILGVYHSHPAGDAAPSPSDLAEAHYPDWAYVIVGLRRRPPVLRAFRIDGGHSRPVELR